jgi:serine/threonine protein kinase
MSKLKGHSHIVSYEDHEVIPHGDEIGWDILIRMELLTPLKKHTDLQKISRDEVVRLGVDLCKALEKCQKEDIIHRDIKPENIFVSADNNYKLGDFGVARTIEKTTGSFTQIGTPPYMAPEVHIGGKYSSCIDIYSLGLTMYRLLNRNRMPFLPAFPKNIEAGDEEIAISKRIKGNKMKPPLDADKKLAEIVLKACAHKPQDRYQKPSEMREALEAIQRDKDTKPGEPPEDDDAEKSEPLSDPVPAPRKPRAKRGAQGTVKMGLQEYEENEENEEDEENEEKEDSKDSKDSKNSVKSEEEPTEQARPPASRRSPVSDRSPANFQHPSKAREKQAKPGYMICGCGAEIRRESISCISCRRQLRRI